MKAMLRRGHSREFLGQFAESLAGEKSTKIFLVHVCNIEYSHIVISLVLSFCVAFD